MRAISILSIFLLLIITNLQAQDSFPTMGGGGSRAGDRGFANDTTARKPRKLGSLIDDTTRMVYGPHTTAYFTPIDWLRQVDEKRHPDTLLNNFHRYSYLGQSNYQRQDLSAIGSPSQNIFYEQPEQIGARLGITALDYLLPKPEEMPFYNTRSPYTYWRYVQGGGGRSMLDAAFARNINERVNAGFLYRRVVSRPLVGLRTVNNGTDRQTDHQNILFHSNYTSSNQRYRVLSFYSVYRTNLLETGGLSYDGISNLDTLFTIDEGLLSNRLSNATGQAKGVQWYGYQSYRPFDSLGLTLFHEWQWDRVEHSYTDVTLTEGELEDVNVYPNAPFFDDTQTYHAVKLQQLDTKAGLKWRRKGIFIGAYYRLRVSRMAHKALNDRQLPQEIPSEHYLGGMAEWKLNKLFDLRASGEYLLFSNYRVNATLSNDLLEVSLRQQLAKPSLVQNFYYSNFFIWNNDFKDVFSTELKAQIHLSLGKNIQLNPTLRLLNISDYIYFDTDAAPKQASEGVNIVQPGLLAKLNLGDWKFDFEGYYTANTQSKLLPMPDLLLNAKAYYEKTFVKGKLPAQIGIDFHWHNAYYAYAYLPVLRQFNLQQDFLVGNYPMASFFVNVRVNRVRLFAKVTNLLQGVPRDGYYLTPGYMAQARQFEFGLVWMFFD